MATAIPHDQGVYITANGRDNPLIREWNIANHIIDSMIDEGRHVPEHMMDRVFDLLAELEREGLI